MKVVANEEKMVHYVREEQFDKNSNEIYGTSKQIHDTKEMFSAENFVARLLEEGEKNPCDGSQDTFNKRNELPIFYDDIKFKRGQQVFHRYIMAMFFSKLLGLITILSVPSISNLLSFTNMSNNRFTAYRRYLGTLFHMYLWYTKEFSPGSKLWKSLEEVKWKHNSASKRHKNSHHSPITQKDMALTQFGFMGYAVSRSKQVGIHDATEEDWEAFIHVWRVIGFLLGMEDRFNICRDSADETRRICGTLINKIFLPEFRKKDQKFLHMSSALITGMWHMQPFLQRNVIMAFTYKRLVNYEEEENNNEEMKNLYSNKLTKNEMYYFNFMITAIKMLKYNVIRIFVNLLQYLTLWLMVHFPFLAYYRFGKANSHVYVLQ